MGEEPRRAGSVARGGALADHPNVMVGGGDRGVSEDLDAQSGLLAGLRISTKPIASTCARNQPRWRRQSATYGAGQDTKGESPVDSSWRSFGNVIGATIVICDAVGRGLARGRAMRHARGMCRFVAYLGEPIPLDLLLLKPANSLVHQSFDAKQFRLRVNGDGFGFAW